MGRYRVLSRIREFTKRGFAVIVPMRRGYGDTGGAWAETYFRCSAPDYYAAGVQAAVDLVATLDYARRLEYVNRERIILFGQSAGGFASIAAASRNPPGVVAVVNFSGGRGGQPDTRPGEPCDADGMTRTIARFAQTIRVPVLWHYAENDRYFAPEHVRAWFRAFEAAGARGTLVMQPPFGNDGHGMFAVAAGLPIWTAAFDAFIRPLGFDYPLPEK
jgi:dienelactone hydrolase